MLSDYYLKHYEADILSLIFYRSFKKINCNKKESYEVNIPIHIIKKIIR